MSEAELAARLRSVPWPALAGCLPQARAAVERVLAGEPAERVLDRALREPAFGRDERAVMAEAVFGVGLWRRRLAYQAGSDAPGALLFALLRDLAGLPEELAGELSGLRAPFPPPRPPPCELATRWSLPDWLAACLVRKLGADGAEAFARAVNRPGPIALRANLLRTSVEALKARLAAEGVPTRAGAHAHTCLVVEAPRANLLPLPAYREGLFEVQDEGSQLLALLVDAHPGETVLELCAGAGGKTLALAAELGNAGALHAFDVDASKLARLEQRARRAGVANLRVHRGTLPESLAVDRVFVDAPCSELGTLRRGPDLRFRLEPATFPALERTQRELLARAARHVRPGGRLVYATCTLRPEENEDPVAAFLAARPDFCLVPPTCLPEAFRRGPFFEALPHLHGTDGFFAAVFERRPA